MKIQTAIIVYSLLSMMGGIQVYPQFAVYPVYAQIDKGNQAKNLTTADYKYLSSTYKMLYNSFDKAATDSLHKYNPELMVIKYINTAEYTSNRDSWDNRQTFRFIEEDKHRKEVLYYTLGLLTKDIESTSTTIYIADGLAPFNNCSTLTKSTTTDIYSTSCQQIVYWVRVGNELMRVTDFSKSGNEWVLSVTRGFENTTPQSYQTGEKAFSPAYRSSGYPGLLNAVPAYFADPATTLRTVRTVIEWEKAVNESFYDGLWMDVFGATAGVSPVKANGTVLNTSQMWDFVSMGNYSDNSLLGNYNYTNLSRVIDSIGVKYGKTPLLFANNINIWNYNGNQVFFQPYGGKRMISMFCQEGASFNGDDLSNSNWRLDRTKPVNIGKEFLINDPSKWLQMFENTRDAAYKGNCIGPIIENAGWISRMWEALDSVQRKQAEMYHYCSYLLAVDPQKTVWLGTVALQATYKSSSDITGYRRPFVNPALRWPIGLPLDTPQKDFVNLKVNEAPLVFARRFENGLVFVCSGFGNPVTINLAPFGTGYFDPTTGNQIDHLHIESNTGIILLKEFHRVELSLPVPSNVYNIINDGKIWLEFNTPMDENTLGVGIIVTETGTGNRVEGIWINETGNRYDFIPDKLLPMGFNYRVFISKDINSSEGYSPVSTSTISFDYNTNSISDINKMKDKIAIFPNPASDIITINFKDINYKEIKIEVQNILGQRMFSKIVKSVVQEKIDLSLFKSGTYIFSLIVDNSVVYSEKIILQR